MVRWTRSAALPLLASLFGLGGCLPAPRATTPAPLADIETPSPQDRSGAMASGRVYVLGQVLAREHERTTELRQQLEHSGEEVERLRTEVAQLRQHESELRAALDKAVAAANTAPPADVAGSSSSLGAANANSNTGSSSRAETDEANQPDSAAAAAGETQRRELDQQHATTVAHLRTAVAEEQQRREKAETELARLKAETSTPPYAANSATDAALAAAKDQVAQLRAELDQERRAREHLARGFRALQEQQRLAAENDGVHNASAESSELHLQIEHLQQEKQSIAQSFKHSLAESQARTVELEHQLTLARNTDHAQTGAVGELAGVQAENAALRSRLDEEHRRTEELGAKLKMALRVTDLIFKMQAQQTASPAQQISPAGQP